MGAVDSWTLSSTRKPFKRDAFQEFRWYAPDVPHKRDTWRASPSHDLMCRVPKQPFCPFVIDVSTKGHERHESISRECVIVQRCFDHILLFLDARNGKIDKEKYLIIMAQIGFLDLVYGSKFLKSLSVLILVNKEPNSRVEKMSEKFVRKLFKDLHHQPKVRFFFQIF